MQNLIIDNGQGFDFGKTASELVSDRLRDYVKAACIRFPEECRGLMQAAFVCIWERSQYCLSPKILVPMRTSVLPAAMAS